MIPITIIASNTNDLQNRVYRRLQKEGVTQNSRNGPVLRFTVPVGITITRPWERVNLCPVRNANPFFHLMEGLAMLGQKNDVKFLAHFAKTMWQYSDDGETFNAFYGTRLRRRWGDQLSGVIADLRHNPDSRQAVALLWDPADLGKPTKDKACNLMLLFQCNPLNDRLDMTSFNRSNDAILGGVCGANIVHLSMFHEYVARSLDRPMGPWHHVSNNLHVYTETSLWARLSAAADKDVGQPYDNMDEEDIVPLFCSPYERGPFDMDLEQFLADATVALEAKALISRSFVSFFIDRVAKPMFNSWQMHKRGELAAAQHHADSIASADWRIACASWLNRRIITVSQ